MKNFFLGLVIGIAVAGVLLILALQVSGKNFQATIDKQKTALADQAKEIEKLKEEKLAVQTSRQAEREMSTEKMDTFKEKYLPPNDFVFEGNLNLMFGKIDWEKER